MPIVKRTVEITASPQAVYAYLADFENAREWDSGTVSCTRVSGDGGPGTVYRNVSRFAGREITLDYTVELKAEPTFVIVGHNKTTTSHDTIVVRPGAEGGSAVDYIAHFTFTGPAKWLGPLVVPLLERLATKTATTLHAALAHLDTPKTT